MLPCDICGKAGHSWFACPNRSTKPADWKPERLFRLQSRQLGKSLTAATIDAARQIMDEGGDPVASIKRQPGRPKSIEDMRSYKAQKQREYRQRQKEAGK